MLAKQKRCFPVINNPRCRANLGYYDLRLPEVREAQAELAKEAGIEGFCYWHYWFAGQRLLERPFEECYPVESPIIPFVCVGPIIPGMPRRGIRMNRIACSSNKPTREKRFHRSF
jgi:hypothetical protein